MRSSTTPVIWMVGFATIMLIVIISINSIIIQRKIDSIRPECKEAASATRYMGGKVEKPKVVYYPRGCWHK